MNEDMNMDAFNGDMYLSLVASLHESGTWSNEMVRKKLTLYAEENNIDMKVMEELIQRITKEREYTLEEKRAFLSVLRLVDGKELKYGDVVESIAPEMIEKLYEVEVANLSGEKIEELHDLAKFKKEQEKVETQTPPEDWYRPLNSEEDVIDESRTESVENWYKSNYDDVAMYIDPVIESNKEKSFVAPAIEREEEPVVAEPVVTFTEEESPVVPEMEQTEDPVVEGEIPIRSVFDFDFSDMAQTDEEFDEVETNINRPERDSPVRQVDASSERVEHLKKGKSKVKNYFLKTAIIIVSLSLLSPALTLPLIGGYVHYARKIKNGEFVPKNNFQELIKNTVEKIMYIGMNKEAIEEERGKSR